MRRVLLSLFLVLSAPVALHAEEPVTGLGVVRRFESKVLGELREFNVLLPLGYEEHPDRRYPVVYLLDGALDEDYFHVAGLVRFFQMYEMMPASILVGIANVDRYRDFTTPTAVEEERRNIPNAGGSDQFRRFVREEVFPYVEGQFRATEQRAIIGQSLGGLMAAQILASSPDDFDDYIVVSPSLWWNGFELASTFGEALAAHPEFEGRVFVALGEEGEDMQAGVDTLREALQAHPSPHLQWHYEPMPDESHATILHRAIYRAFEWLYGEEYPGL